jgi:8-oxo-dGTP pyrophosphatase MutT (NUDIX family)
MKLDKLRRERTQIVAEGKLQLDNIDCSYSPVRISFNINEKSWISKVWKKQVKDTPSIFDGRLFHVKRQEYLFPQLRFDTCLSSFKEWVGTRSYTFKQLFGRDRIVKPLSVGSMVVTADNKWIIGRRYGTYDFEGQYTLPAGYMDPNKDLIESKPDPYSALKREIEEETGINKKHDIGNIICLGLNGTEQPYLAFITHLKLSYKELVSNIPEEKEFRRFEVHQYETKHLENFIVTKFKEMTPHTLANMLMSSRVLET